MIWRFDGETPVGGSNACFRGNPHEREPAQEGKDAIHQFDTFNPDTGKRLSMKVTDLGEEVLTRHGVPRRTHHYKIADTLTGEFARDVWSIIQ